MISPSMTPLRYRTQILTSLTTAAGVASPWLCSEVGCASLRRPSKSLPAHSCRFAPFAGGRPPTDRRGRRDRTFSVAGARHTGNPPANRDVTVVILGDSYVMAREVADRETMGSQLERTARASGLPLDVRQYGWSGASPAQYLYVARDVLARWHPRRVMIPLSENDLDMSALVEPWPKLRVDRRWQCARIVGPPMDTLITPRIVVALMLTQHRWATLRRRGPRHGPDPARCANRRPAGGRASRYNPAARLVGTRGAPRRRGARAREGLWAEPDGGGVLRGRGGGGGGGGGPARDVLRLARLRGLLRRGHRRARDHADARVAPGLSPRREPRVLRQRNAVVRHRAARAESRRLRLRNSHGSERGPTRASGMARAQPRHEPRHSRLLQVRELLRRQHRRAHRRVIRRRSPWSCPSGSRSSRSRR